MSTTTKRFNFPLIAVHWLTLALIAGAYITNQLQDAFEHTPTEALLQHWHTMFGVTVLGLVALRLLVRALSRAPAVEPPPPRWQSLAASLAHVALYGLMIALPLTGWLTFNADGHVVTWFGQSLPMLVSASKSLAHTLKEIHEAFANAGYFLIGLHAAAALFHHYVMRDNTLQLMWPLARAATR
jgi:superoxide oxidase